MLMCRRCLYCYQPLEEAGDYHLRCARRFFGTAKPPLLPYTRRDLLPLAEQVIRSQTALTGVQPKLSLDLSTDAGGGRLTIVGLWGRYILKPQTEAYPHLPEIEDVVMHMAELARIQVVPHSLIRFADGELCYITRRVDRMPHGEKLPMEDCCQLSERLTEDKYKGSHERVAKLIAQFSCVPRLDLVRYWEVVLFAWLTGNADMHLKNFSLYAPDNSNSYILAPAYDLVSTALVMPQDPEELALTLCGKKRKIDASHFRLAMLQSGLSDKVCTNMLTRLCKMMPPWEACIARSFLPADMQDRLIEILRQRIKLLEH